MTHQRISLGRAARTAATLLGFSVLMGHPGCGQPGKTLAGSGGTGGGSSDGGAGGGDEGGGGGAGAGTPVKIMNWNVRNFFDTKKDTASADEQVLSGADYADKRDRVGSILNELTPDVVIMPELENKDILDDLNATELGGLYETAITDTNDFRGLDIGILSKVPIDAVVTHADDQFKAFVGGMDYKYSRDAVEVHITVNGREIVLLGVHYRSKGDGSPETDDPTKRFAEAKHTRDIADELIAANPKIGVIILGDFNDLPGSNPVKYTEEGEKKVLFTSAADNVPQADRWTFVYNGTKELIDHQFSSPLLAPMLDPTSVKIRHINDIDTSDHDPLMATYVVH